MSKEKNDCKLIRLDDDVALVSMYITREIYEDIRDMMLKSQNTFYTDDFTQNFWVNYEDI